MFDLFWTSCSGKLFKKKKNNNCWSKLCAQAGTVVLIDFFELIYYTTTNHPGKISLKKTVKFAFSDGLEISHHGPYKRS